MCRWKDNIKIHIIETGYVNSSPLEQDKLVRSVYAVMDLRDTIKSSNLLVGFLTNNCLRHIFHLIGSIMVHAVHP
jgi:hypothetical protein